MTLHKVQDKDIGLKFSDKLASFKIPSMILHKVQNKHIGIKFSDKLASLHAQHGSNKRHDLLHTLFYLSFTK